VARGCRLIIKMIDDEKIGAYAIANAEEATAPYLLAKLGFKPTGIMTPVGEYLFREPR